MIEYLRKVKLRKERKDYGIKDIRNIFTKYYVYDKIKFLCAQVAEW